MQTKAIYMINSQSISTSASTPAVRVWRLTASLPVLAILALQTITSLSLRNTAFQDEALYLYAGRQIFNQLLGGPPVTEPYERYFSGLPYLYPVLAGALDIWGGLEAARLLSLICMLWATVAVYLLGKQLYDRDSGLLGAALLAVQGSVLFLGRLATYDAMSLALLALGSVVAVWAARARWPLGALLVGPILLLAVATKYAALLFVPTVLALLAWQTLQAHGWRQMLLRAGLAVGVMLAAGASALALAARGDGVVNGLQSTTTNRVALMTASRLLLARDSALWGGGLFLLALLGLVLVGRKRLPLAVVLLGTALLAPAYHIYKAESISLHKHVAFGLFFAAPLAGCAVARFCGYGRGEPIGRRWLAGLALCLVLFGVGQSQAQDFYAQWANSDSMIRVLQTQVRPGSGHILAEESEVPRYYLQDIVAFWQWNHLYWFEYTSKAGDKLSGEAAYKAAIDDGYFDLVILRYGPNAELDHRIDGGLRNNGRYEQIAKLPYYTMFGAGDYWIWRRVK
jgi:hypothetical protein